MKWAQAILLTLTFTTGEFTASAQILQTIYSFNGNNGIAPVAALTLGNDGNFYGTTVGGGTYDYGTVFRVTTNGTLTTLVSFNSTDKPWPKAALTLGNDGNFYGTTQEGGTYSDGTVFRVTTNGTLTTLVSFDGTNGRAPTTALTLGKDGNLYGTTLAGGNAGVGTIFQMTTNGTLTTLVSFSGSSLLYPSALTLGKDGNFYGTTQEGGAPSGGTVIGGTVFRLSYPPPPPTLTLQFSTGYPLLSLQGTLGETYAVQYSANLASTNWINLLSLTNLPASPYFFEDTSSVGQPARFYRVLMQ